MEPFISTTGVAAPLPLDNVDTDVIVRVPRSVTFGRGELGPWAFESLRYEAEERPNPGFVLNRPPFDRATILLAGRNFGCGSSRETAVWALQDFGFRCIVAPSYGDIFYGNCFQNGLLPVVLDAETIERLAAARGNLLTVDLVDRRITDADGAISVAFEVEPLRRRMLLEGLDEIGLTLSKMAAIRDFQARDARERPWIRAYRREVA